MPNQVDGALVHTMSGNELSRWRRPYDTPSGAEDQRDLKCEEIQSRIKSKRNSLLLIASVMKLYASNGSTSRQEPFNRRNVSVTAKLVRLFPSRNAWLFASDSIRAAASSARVP